MPPSAMMGTFRAAATLAHSMIELIIGTPMPATTRVVQIDPAPMPTFTASTPAADQRLCRIRSRNVSGDELGVRKFPAHARDHVDHVL